MHHPPAGDAAPVDDASSAPPESEGDAASVEDDGTALPEPAGDVAPVDDAGTSLLEPPSGIAPVDDTSTEPPAPPAPAGDAAPVNDAVPALPEPATERAPWRPNPTQTLAVPSGSLECIDCRTRIEQRLRSDPRIEQVSLDPGAQVARVVVQSGPIREDELTELIASARGERGPLALPTPHLSSHAHRHAVSEAAEPGVMGHAGHDQSDPRLVTAMEADLRRRFWISLALAIPVVLYSPLVARIAGLTPPTPFGVPHDWVLLAFCTPIAIWSSSVFHQGAYAALRSRTLNMSVLVSLGIQVCYGFSLGLTLFAPGQETFYEAAALLAVFVLFGHWMEMKARHGGANALRALLGLAPRQATVERNGVPIDLPLGEVAVGDLVVLKPGDRAAVDGVVQFGQSAVDESAIGGDDAAGDKVPGDLVISGSLNLSGWLRVRATRIGPNTTLARIVTLVQGAQNSQATGQRLADRAASSLVLAAIGIGLLTFLIWLLALQAPLSVALGFAVTVIIVASPDALALATPTAVLVAIDLAAKRGILFTRATALEQAARIQSVVFDTTALVTAETPRPNAAQAVAALKRLGIEPLMISGESRGAANALALTLGIERVLAEVLPQDRAAGIQELQAQGRLVAMVGDGIADAPALTQADLGIAIGAAADVAVESGDIVLMHNDPLDVAAAIQIARATRRTTHQNLWWAAIYNLIAIPIAAGILYPAFGLLLRPELGALATSAASLAVLANALLLRHRLAPPA